VFPTKATIGKLQLARAGSILHYRAADGLRGTFRELCQDQIGSEDVRLVRLAANTGGSPTALDVRLSDLRIRSARLPNEPATVYRQRRGWLAWLIPLGAAAIGLAVTGYVRWQLRRARALA